LTARLCRQGLRYAITPNSEIASSSGKNDV
jgi:hypothetical protein